MSRSITTPPWMGCQSIIRSPSVFHQASLTIQRHPFFLLGERSTVRVQYFYQVHNTLAWPDLKSKQLQPEFQYTNLKASTVSQSFCETMAKFTAMTPKQSVIIECICVI